MKIWCIFILIQIIVIDLLAQEKFSINLKEFLKYKSENEPIKVWIYFTDKGNDIQKYFRNPLLVISERSIERRKKVFNQNSLIDFDDLPVNQNYLSELSRYVKELRYPSKWFNSVSAFVYPNKLYEIEKLPFVKKIDLVQKFRKKIEPVNNEETIEPEKNQIINENLVTENITMNFNYGPSLTQNQQIMVVAVHNTGNYGQGVWICLMDAGYNRLTHEVFQNMHIVATWDFVNNRPYVGDGQGGQGSGSHGTQTLSTIGGFKEGQLIGPAFASTYILAKTENTESETPIEMDNWARALEWADSIGVDITSTSLGYLEFDPPYPSYNWTHMDGNTVPITIAADLAVKRGIVVINSAGNEGYHQNRNTLVAPADGDSVIAVGAVTSTGSRASFSSVGNTVDGRIKPDVMAMGSGVRVASPFSNNGYSSASGTSFSCPLAAGVAALILSENPSLTPMQVRDAMRNTASNANNPNREMGWGILNALAAVNYFNIVFSHTPPRDSLNLNGPYRIAVKITSRLGVDPTSVKLFWGRGVITDSMLMLEATGDTFYAFIPGNGQPATYKYYIQARTLDGSITKNYPKRAPQELLEFRVGNFVAVNNSSGWNLISAPVISNNLTISQAFNNPQSRAYYFDGKYVISDTVHPGLGFWLKFNSAGTSFIPGNPLTGISIPVKSGWNLIGSLSTNIPVYSIASVPPNIMVSPFYGYNGGYYNSPIIEKGRGYWIKTNQNGYLILNSNLISKNRVDYELFNLEDLSKILIKDNRGNQKYLYFGKVDFDTELPPRPPSDIFDVRFFDSRVVSEKLFDLIELQGVEFPLEVSYISKQKNEVEIFEPITNKILFKLRSEESYTINTLQTNFLGVRINSDGLSYKLFNNYPNPFNAQTKIRYQIPEKTSVTLKVFNSLGEEILRLVDEEKEIGEYTVDIDFSRNVSIPSGIYYYQLITLKYIQTNKMVYVK